MSIWIHVHVFTFTFSAFFFFFSCVFCFLRQILLFITFHNIVHGIHNHFIQKKNIKNESHGTIYTFKNYFTTAFSVFSFSKNKLYPNEPLKNPETHLKKKKRNRRRVNFLIERENVNLKKID